MKTSTRFLMAVPVLALAAGGAAFGATPQGAEDAGSPGCTQQGCAQTQTRAHEMAQARTHSAAPQGAQQPDHVRARVRAHTARQDVRTQQHTRAGLQSQGADSASAADRDQVRAHDGTGDDQQRDQARDRDGSCEETS